MKPSYSLRGVDIFERFLDAGEQAQMVRSVRGVVARAPLFSPVTASGKQMSVRMTSAGRVGWIADRRGYRYSEAHPSGVAWPTIPEEVVTVWSAVSGVSVEPECCLINYYDRDARMGMHQDKDEADFGYPVVSISLGDDARFRIGNLSRGGKTESVMLRSGDVVVMGGSARLAYHGIDRIDFGTSMLLPKGGRLNLTLRVVS